MANNNIKLSICIPTYNRFEYLRLTVNHLLRELKNVNIQYEIIVADGGSTDSTTEYLNSIPEIKLIPGGLNNLCAAYYELFQKSSGEYILFMTDKILVNIGVIEKVCNLMDDDPMLGLLTYKFNVFKQKEPYKIVDNHFKEKISFADHCLFRREDALKYWDKNYNKRGCLYEFCLNILFSGKIIGYSKDITAYEVKFRHYDYLHFKFGWRKGINTNDGDVVRKKYSRIFNIIESDVSGKFLTRLRVIIFQKLVNLYRRLINKKFIATLEKFVNKKYSGNNIDEVYPYIPANEIPPELGPILPGIYPENSASISKMFLNPHQHHQKENYDDVDKYLISTHTQLKQMSSKEHWQGYFEDQILDRRIKLPYIKELLDWLMQGTYCYSLKNYKYSNYIYPVQQLPAKLVELINNEISKSKYKVNSKL